MFGETAVDTIGIITIVATFITSLISLFTLLEMKKQRIESTRPNIIPVDSYYSLKSYSDGRFTVFTQFNGKYDQNAYLFLANVGNGSAINLRVMWSFNFKEFICNFRNEEINYHYDENIFSIRAPTYSNEHNIKLQKEERITYLLTAENEKQKILFPQYINVIMKIINDLRKKGNGNRIPDLEMKIEYEDSSFRKYHSEYRFVITEHYNIPFIPEEKLEYINVWKYQISKK
jgi:hypothetical protein